MFDVISEESPEAARRIVARLKERQALRRSVDFPTLEETSGSLEDSMWRDPLDELIDDLERVAPDHQETFPFETIQAIADAVLYGSPTEVARLTADPAYQRWVETVE